MAVQAAGVGETWGVGSGGGGVRGPKWLWLKSQVTVLWDTGQAQTRELHSLWVCVFRGRW